MESGDEVSISSNGSDDCFDNSSISEEDVFDSNEDDEISISDCSLSDLSYISRSSSPLHPLDLNPTSLKPVKEDPVGTILLSNVSFSKLTDTNAMSKFPYICYQQSVNIEDTIPITENENLDILCNITSETDKAIVQTVTAKYLETIPETKLIKSCTENSVESLELLKTAVLEEINVYKQNACTYLNQQEEKVNEVNKQTIEDYVNEIDNLKNEETTADQDLPDNGNSFDSDVDILERLKKELIPLDFLNGNDGNSKIERSQQDEMKDLAIETELLEKNLNNKLLVIECPTCHAVFWDEKQAKEHEESHIAKKTCHICHKSFVRRDYLEKHLNIHANLKISCELCGKKYSCSNNLHRHIRLYHDNIRNYVCILCGRAFGRSEALQSHLTTHNSGTEKNFKCERCRKEFKTETRLIAHVLAMHNGDKRPSGNVYNCTQCAFQTSSYTSFCSHKLVHSAAKPFTCEVCKKPFRTVSAVYIHMRIHNNERPHQCDFCPAAFRQSHHLSVHRRKHTGERPYSCSFCDKAFTSSGARDSHARRHTGEKLFQCDICKDRFANHQSFKRHKLKKHIEGVQQATDVSENSTEQ